MSYRFNQTWNVRERAQHNEDSEFSLALLQVKSESSPCTRNKAAERDHARTMSPTMSDHSASTPGNITLLRRRNLVELKCAIGNVIQLRVPSPQQWKSRT